MTISIDATTLLLRSAGVKNYLNYWLLALAAAGRAHGDEIRAYPLGVPVPSAVDHERPSASRLGARFRLGLVELGNIIETPLPDLLLAGSDRFHASQHIKNVPRRQKVSATVFDLSCWITPEYHTDKNVAATKLYGERVLKRCAGLIAISAHARNDATEILQIPGDRIQVIYPGVADSFFVASAVDAKRFRAKYGVEGSYILFVGCIEPRKNIPGLIRAYKATSKAFQRDVKLVVAGPFGWEGSEVRSLLSDDPRNIVYLRYVPEADLPGLFYGASALVYPSYYEGFGLPVAQAMATGTPVICSNRGSLPEVVGDAGICVDPDSLEHIRTSIEQVLGSSDLSSVLASRGRSRAEQFRWNRCAEESLKFFHDL